ncbi:MAG: GAF domain-containing protein [Anaerolineales bacterium]
MLLSPFPFAFVTITLGGLLLIGVWLALRWLGSQPPHAYVTSPIPATLELTEAESGLVIAQTGGKVLFVNERAQQWLGGEANDLTSLSRRVRPSDTFIELFSNEGTARFNLGASGKQVEATSLQLPAINGTPARTVVVLKESGRLPELGAGDERATQTLAVLSEISRAISASLDLGATFEAVLTNVGRIFSYDAAEITLWEPASQVLRPAQIAGNRAYAQLVLRGDFAYRLDEGLSGFVASRRVPLTVPDLQTFTQARTKVQRAEFPFRAYAGVPLLVGQQLVGTLELISYRVNAYRLSDLPLLTAIAGQAAIAIQNAQLYSEQQRRVAELTGLAEIARAVEATADPRELYGRLTSDIARLMGVQMVGFLLYDEREHALLAQPPFRGLPDIVVEAYRLPIEPDSIVEQIWRESPYWMSNAVQNDPLAETLNLRELAETAGVHTTLIVPITIGNRRVGAVQVSNRVTNAPFNEQDVRLLTIFAGQTAAILENARLVREAEARAARTEGLRQIAATAAGEADLDTILRTTMEQAAALLHFEIGVVALLDEAQAELIPHPASIIGEAREEIEAARIRADDPYFQYSVTRTREAFITGHATRDRRVIGPYKPIVQRYRINSVMGAPLTLGERGLGEIIVAARRENAFTEADLQLLATVAAQLASAIDRARLYTATDQTLQRRVNQLESLTRISREINQTLNLERLLLLVQSEALVATRAEAGSIVLLETDDEKAGTIALRIGDDETRSVSFKQSASPIAARELELIERDALIRARGQRAEIDGRAHLVVPIFALETVAGLIHLHRAGEAFDDEALDAAVALAAQTSIAVGNAQRYAEQLQRAELLRRRADQLSQLFNISRSVRSDKSLEENLEAIAYGMQEAVGFNVVSVNLLEPQVRRTKRVAVVGLPLQIVEATRHIEQPWENLQRLMRDEFRVSQSYFLPNERAAEYTRAVQTAPMPAPRRVADEDPNAWDPEDMFIVPLAGSGNDLLGLISLDDPRDGLRPDRATVEIAEIFANQAALTIENARLFGAAERRAARLLALHRVIERVIALPDRAALWQTVAEAVLAEMKFDLCLIALLEHGHLLVKGRAGSIRPEIKLEPLLRQPNPLTHVIEQNYPAFSTNIKRSDWEALPFVPVLNISSFVCVPVTLKGEAVGALFVGQQHLPSPFTGEDLDTFTILTNQLSAELESLGLETDIQTRAAQLAALVEASRTVTATLRSQDVVQAVLATMKNVVPHDSLTLWLRDGEQLRIAAAQGFEDNAVRLGLTVNIADSALFAEMTRTGSAIRVADTHADARFPGSEFQPTRSWLGAPLISTGSIIGALVLDKKEENFYAPLALQLLSAYATQTAAALANARLFEENEQRSDEIAARSRRLALLNRVSSQLTSTLDVESMHETLVREVMTALAVSEATVFSVDEAGTPEPALHLPFDGQAPVLLAAAFDRLRETLAPLAIEDVAADPMTAGDQAALAERGVKSALIMPLVAARAIVGVLQLEETQARRRFTPAEIELAQTLANQAAVAVQNARLFTEVQLRNVELSQRNERMTSFNQLSTSLSASLDLSAILRETAEQLVEMFGVDHSSLILVDEHMQSGVVEEEYPPLGALGLRLTLSTDAVAHQVLARRVVIVKDVASDERLSDEFRAKLTMMGVQSALLAPFISQGRAFGAFSIDSFTPREFTTPDIELCQTTAAQIAAALTNARSARDLETRVQQRTGELEHERERVQTLLQITTELSSSLDLDLVLNRALKLVTEAVSATQGSIFLIDPESDRLVYRAALGGPKALPPGGETAPFKRNEGFVGWVIKQRQAAVIDNLENDKRWKQMPDQNISHKSVLAVPLMANEEVMGALLLFSPLYNAFDEDQLRLVEAAANQVGAASNNSELYRMIRDQAERLGSLLRTQQVDNQKNRAILDGIADGVLVTDADGKIILFNPACERILSLERGQVLGRPVREFLGIYGSAGGAWLEAVTRWSNNPQSYKLGEVFSQRIDIEASRIVSVLLTPVLTGDEYLGAVSLIRDITREVEIDRLKSDFVTNVSHELRTPITPIKASVDLLLMGASGPTTPMQQNLLNMIKANADRLTHLVNDLLDTARVESGELAVVKLPIGLGDVVDDVFASLRGLMTQTGKSMTLRADLPDDLPLALGDPLRVTQVLSNLAENAFNYSNEDGVITISARVDEAGQAMVVEVTDTGLGIAPADRGRLFDRFFRGENALVMATSGTGLGLPIARQLIEMQGGKLWLKETDVGRGSTFAFTLPLAATEQTTA